jgi:hypothetical protein
LPDAGFSDETRGFFRRNRIDIATTPCIGLMRASEIARPAPLTNATSSELHPTPTRSEHHRAAIDSDRLSGYEAGSHPKPTK